MLVVTLGAPAAHGDPATAFDLGVFHPVTLPSSAVITVERPTVLPAGVLGAALTFDYGKNPLFALRGASGDREAAVSDRAAALLAVAYGLRGRADLVLALPLLAQHGTAGMTGIVAADGAAIGDVEARARVLVARGLAVSGGITLPTGDAGRYAGQQGLGADVRAVGGLERGRWAFAANAGLRLRFAEARLGDIRQANEITFGAGASARVAATVEALGEIYGALGLVGEMRAASPVEALVAVRAWPTAVVALTAGGGAGLVDGIGAADVRVFIGVAYAPRPAGLLAVAPTHAAEPAPAEPAVKEPDADDDGVPDSRDKCPDSVEDRDGFQDDDGCDDPDNDGDGIPDVVDECALEPETINGVMDDDGCPDRGEAAIILLQDRIQLLQPIAFEGATLRADARNVIGQVASTLRAHKDMRVHILVHTRRTQDRGVDQRLSDRRADAIRKVFVDKGIAEQRVQIEGVGSSRPLGKRTLDERIEVLIE